MISATPAALLAQADGSTTASLKLQPATVSGSKTSNAKRRKQGKFPSVFKSDEVDNSDTRVVAVRGENERFAFTWIKFSLILIAYFVWLRELRLCVDDGRNLNLKFGSWYRKLFVIGLVGILVAIMVPAYLLGVCILGVSCGIPFWRYMYWRNAQVNDHSPRLEWKHLFASPFIPFHSVPDAQFELPSSLSIGASVAKIALVGKSFSERVTEATSQDSGIAPSGFQLALAVMGHAIAMRATDLHIGTKDDQVILRLRIDGELVPMEPLSIASGLSVINVFKVLSDLNIADKRRAQDGSFRADVDGRRLCFRISSQGTNTGEKLSIRILDPAANFATFPALGLTTQLESRLEAILSRSNGLTLFVGATGAGKSTTAYAGLRFLDTGDRNIITIEDPIEYSIPTIDQIEVKTRSGQTFKSGLRSLLRQDADVVLIGEIRDEETAKIACQAATTGQLVLSTLHATDSITAIFRMLDLGVDPYNIAAALRGVVSQQLVRRLCTKCRTPYTPDAEELQKLALINFHGPLYHKPDPLTNPCAHCNSRGILGRTGIFELLDVTHTIRDLIRDRANANAITSVAREGGMTTLWDDGLRLVRDGIISSQEFLRVVDEL
ncbi:MAG: type II/IV secretion system protein [Planctomycetaceae bacterium]|nr:type II/IV secretion system protein [Planctomycetales bacterium]MCB9926313.1 type II/IV secretion system protein [Planctomycetaceae bacterium]